MDAVEAVRRTRSSDTYEEFERRVTAQADALRETFAADGFEGGYVLGLELEGYAVDAEGRLTNVPTEAFERICERELGRHNAEVNTPASGFDSVGLVKQARSLDDCVTRVRQAFSTRDRRFVTDGMWTVGPSQGDLAYLTATEERDGRPLPANLAPSPRYYALNADIISNGGVELDLPVCRRQFDSIIVESLATSMQAHVQMPTEAFPQYFNAALRTAGAVLALAANAPFLPPGLYTDPDPERVLTAGVELRIPVFESMNVRDPGKVRFPRDIDRPVDVVDRIVADRLCAPYLREWVDDSSRDGFADENWELLHKQGTCWRWVRPVLGPEGPRIEYRILAAQPSTADVIGFQALVAGLLHGVAVTDHPLLDLPWEAAHESLYAASRDGFDADLAWVTREGDRTSDPEQVYPDLFALARAGLRDRGFEPDRVDDLLAPIERRWEERTSPADWKRAAVRDRLGDGASLEEAIHGMQREYIQRSCANKPFATWDG